MSLTVLVVKGFKKTFLPNLGSSCVVTFFVITVFFTVVSIVRSYVIRRFFNKKHTDYKKIRTEYIDLMIERELNNSKRF